MRVEEASAPRLTAAGQRLRSERAEATLCLSHPKLAKAYQQAEAM